VARAAADESCPAASAGRLSKPALKP